MSGGWMRIPGKTWRLATLAGVGIGGVYALSPLTVWFALAMWPLVRYAGAGLDEDERRWVTALLVCAIALRVAAVAALFATTNHAQVPFGTFFGDEEFYLRRSIWMRNMALGIPIHTADLIYVFDPFGWTSQLYAHAFLQTLVGPSPYGVRLFGIAAFLLGAVVLFRTVRPAFGRAPSVTGLAFLLFLPSLFAWSISALKEPLYFLMTASSVALSMKLVRDRRWGIRLLVLAALGGLVAAIGTVRDGGAMLAGGGLVVGLVAAWLVRRPRALIALAVTLPIVVGAALSVPKTQLRAYTLIQSAARLHLGHVKTRGWIYPLLDRRFYDDEQLISDMRFAEAARYVARAGERYVTVPLPWESKSTAALAYLPEQMLWYAVVALLPFGLLFSLRRDIVLTALLAGIAVTSAAGIALVSGNVGTLVRLRVLAIPYVACLSMVGLCELLARAVRPGESRVFEKAETI